MMPKPTADAKPHSRTESKRGGRAGSRGSKAASGRRLKEEKDNKGLEGVAEIRIDYVVLGREATAN